MTLALFYIAGAIALAATGIALTRVNAIHALIYLVVSLLAVAFIFFLLGAPFAAVLEIVIYAGAIMVLFVFVIMMLNLGNRGVVVEQEMMKPSIWIIPSLLCLILLIELSLSITSLKSETNTIVVSAKEIGISLFGPYVLAVEIASMLLLAGLVAANHIGRRLSKMDQERDEG